MAETAVTLRRLVDSRSALLVPGAYDALSARVIADIGFQALYVSGAGITNGLLGMPDMGFISLSQLAQQVSLIRDAVELPLIVDADTGFGNAVNVHYTARTLARAGADALQIEDQISPKRCGHFAGKGVIAADEMVQKIRAAKDAVAGDGVLIVARTDAYAVEGMNGALDRANAFIEAGADMTFVEAPRTAEDIGRILSSLSVPQVVNMVIGGVTPAVGLDDLRRMKAGVVLYANAALQGAVLGMQRALTALRDAGTVSEDSQLVASFAERQRLVRKPEIDRMERTYSGGD